MYCINNDNNYLLHIKTSQLVIHKIDGTNWCTRLSPPFFAVYDVDPRKMWRNNGLEAATLAVKKRGVSNSNQL